ncbi:4-hydroxy-tetrahydrodipicolinate reductase [bacterium]|nr:4-hydroxy-tetrahydrodipicolinate reductase [bacterium]
MTTNVIITGALGRMGQTLVTRATEQSQFYTLVGATEYTNHPQIGEALKGVTIENSLELVLSKTKNAVVIDFTSPKATLAHLEQIQKHGAKIVIGTTGFEPAEKKKIIDASKKTAIVMASNMSVGVNTLFSLVSMAAKILNQGYDIEVIEAHHKLKKDAPSGTAVSLAEVLAEATKRIYPDNFNFHREGMIGERKQSEIGMQVIRGGDIVGEHTVMFCGMGERLELKHIATSRSTFADGALRAAAWLSSKQSGLYDMRDVLGIPKN